MQLKPTLALLVSAFCITDHGLVSAQPSEPIPEPEVKNRVSSGQQSDDIDTGFYASLGMSIGINADIPVKETTPIYSDESFKTSTTIGPNVAVGYSFPEQWRVELEYLGLFADTSDQFKLKGQQFIDKGDQVSTNIFQLNLIKDLPTSSRLTPYLGGGLGLAHSVYSVRQGSAAGSSFAAQGKAGLALSLTPRTRMYLGYRVVWINGGTTLDFWSDRPSMEGHLQQSVDMGVRVML